jgi:hypothetical protein
MDGDGGTDAGQSVDNIPVCAWRAVHEFGRERRSRNILLPVSTPGAGRK